MKLKLNTVLHKPDYQAAYHILMHYWDFIPEEEKWAVHQSLNIALGECESTTADEYNVTMGSNSGQNDALKAVSQESGPKYPEKIKGALNRLKEQFGFGVKDSTDA